MWQFVRALWARSVKYDPTGRTYATGATVQSAIAQLDAALVAHPGATALGYFNVKDPTYGAVGDGTADDTTAIAAAVTAAALVNGTVFFPQGTYKTAKITLSAGVSLVGVGITSSIIKSKNAEPLVEWINGSLSLAGKIEDLSFVGNSTGTKAFNFRDVYDFNFHRCTVQGFTTHGFYGEGAMLGIFYDCHFVDCPIGLYLTDYSGNRPNLVRVVDGNFYNCTSFGIQWVNGSMLKLDGVDIELCGTNANSATAAMKVTGTLLGVGVSMRNTWFEGNFGKADLWITAPGTDGVRHTADSCYFCSTATDYNVFFDASDATHHQTLILRGSQLTAGATKSLGSTGINGRIAQYDCSVSTATVTCRRHKTPGLSRNSQSSNYAAVPDDLDTIIVMAKGSAGTVTIPPVSTAGWKEGDMLFVRQEDGFQYTLTPGAGVTLHSPSGLKTATQYAPATLVMGADDVWAVSGTTSA